MKKKILFYLSTLLFLLSCSTAKLTTEITTQNLGNPPETQKIADNLYIDQMEIRNIDYLEFLHWVKSVYGNSSMEYKSIYPDTNIWSDLNPNYASLDTNYLNHPIFRKLAVLGVTNKQAQQYVKWRSDRVMEFILIKYGVLKYQQKVTKDSIFTIEKYFAGQYNNIKPNPYLIYFPEYKLLDSTEDTRMGFKNICTYKKWKPSPQ
ncbi:MAG: hypothetical protein A3F72_19460 [Bacteroidetes bacterium RIFCSPLOWO2_12_FULL_35_15]|nr:MAG: hypothetical protein A3F72_19460 [Bacteroidetes bacterium RIFCSPLOWO2_12_FULL_35_15]